MRLLVGITFVIGVVLSGCSEEEVLVKSKNTTATSAEITKGKDNLTKLTGSWSRQTEVTTSYTIFYDPTGKQVVSSKASGNSRLVGQNIVFRASTSASMPASSTGVSGIVRGWNGLAMDLTVQLSGDKLSVKGLSSDDVVYTVREITFSKVELVQYYTYYSTSESAEIVEYLITLTK